MTQKSSVFKLSEAAIKLINAGGADLLRELEADAVRDVVYRVMVGQNLRDSTEELTRRKLLALNAAVLHFLATGVHSDPRSGADSISEGGPMRRVFLVVLLCELAALTLIAGRLPAELRRARADVRRGQTRALRCFPRGQAALWSDDGEHWYHPPAPVPVNWPRSPV